MHGADRAFVEILLAQAEGCRDFQLIGMPVDQKNRAPLDIERMGNAFRGQNHHLLRIPRMGDGVGDFKQGFVIDDLFFHGGTSLWTVAIYGLNHKPDKNLSCGSRWANTDQNKTEPTGKASA